MSIETLFVVVE